MNLLLAIKELTEEGPCCIYAYNWKKQSKWQNRHNNLHLYRVYDEQIAFPGLHQSMLQTTLKDKQYDIITPILYMD